MTLRKVLCTMQVRGRTSPAEGNSNPWKTTGSAVSCVIHTVISAAGIQTDLASADGELAFFESELLLTGNDEFEESGEIAFGDSAEHILRFSTAGHGHMNSGLEPGMIAGTASWKVDSGEGQFAEAQGFITSNFTITTSGERCDLLCGVIFLPEAA